MNFENYQWRESDEYFDALRKSEVDVLLYVMRKNGKSVNDINYVVVRKKDGEVVEIDKNVIFEKSNYKYELFPKYWGSRKEVYENSICVIDDIVVVGDDWWIRKEDVNFGEYPEDEEDIWTFYTLPPRPKKMENVEIRAYNYSYNKQNDPYILSDLFIFNS